MNIDNALNILEVTTLITSRDELKSAYRQVAMKYHPDRNPYGENKMKAINEAYDFLTGLDIDLIISSQKSKAKNYGHNVVDVNKSIDFNQVVKGVVLSGAVNLYIKFGDKAELNLMGKGLNTIKAYVEENTLFISQVGNVISSTIIIGGNVTINTTSISNDEVECVLTLPSLEFIKASGAGNVYIKDFKGDRLNLLSSGASNIKINGVVNVLNAKTSGSGNIKANELLATQAILKTSGSGNIKVHVSDSLIGKTSGSGNITIFGMPKAKDVKSSGSGTIKYK